MPVPDGTSALKNAARFSDYLEVNIIVTGADGYLGSRLVPVLIDRGHQVTALDAGFYHRAWLDGFPLPPEPTLIADVRDITARDLEGFDAVVHMAELSNDPLGALDPSLTQRINFEGSSQLARNARSAGVSTFVYMSSCSVYGAAEGVVDEDSPLRPQTEYARCKAKVEDVLQTLASPEFNPVALRNATAFGASPRLRLDLVVNDLCAQAYTERRLTLSSDGSPWRPLVHALDIARAIAAVLESPRGAVDRAVLNVGVETNNLRVRDIAGLVSEAFGGLEVTMGSGGGDVRSYAVDFTRLRAALSDFHCEWSVQAGIEELRDSFRSNDLRPQDVSGGRFSRIATLENLRSQDHLDSDLRWLHPSPFPVLSPLARP